MISVICLRSSVFRFIPSSFFVLLTAFCFQSSAICPLPSACNLFSAFFLSLHLKKKFFLLYSIFCLLSFLSVLCVLCIFNTLYYLSSATIVCSFSSDSKNAHLPSLSFPPGTARHSEALESSSWTVRPGQSARRHPATGNLWPLTGGISIS